MKGRRVCIKFSYINLEKSDAEIVEVCSKKAFNNDSLARSQIFECRKWFKENRTSIDNWRPIWEAFDIMDWYRKCWKV